MYRFFMLLMSGLLWMVFTASPGSCADNGPTPAGGRITGAPRQTIDTYAISLSSAQGVRPRDIVQISRGNREVARAVVVYAGPEYSLVVVNGSANTTVKIGDSVAWSGHMALPPYQLERPRGETVIVKERDVMSSRAPGHPSFTMPSFSTPSFGTASFSTPGFSAPSFSAPGFSAPSYSSPGFSAPSYSQPSLGAPTFGQPSFSMPTF